MVWKLRKDPNGVFAKPRMPRLPKLPKLPKLPRLPKATASEASSTSWVSVLLEGQIILARYLVFENMIVLSSKHE